MKSKYLVWKRIERYAKEDCIIPSRVERVMDLPTGLFRASQAENRFPNPELVDGFCYMFRITPYNLFHELPTARKDRMYLEIPDSLELFYTNLDYYCKERNMTYKDAAEAIGTKQDFSRSKRKQRFLTYETIEKLMNLFNIDLCDFFINRHNFESREEID